MVRSEKKGTLNCNEGGYELSHTWDALLVSRDRNRDASLDNASRAATAKY